MNMNVDLFLNIARRFIADMSVKRNQIYEPI